jgi:glycosyltransferase involved in cell wall biosynthesis/ADP-heptose:LPS heptosyltransferase
VFDTELEDHLTVLGLQAPVDVRQLLGGAPRRIVAVCTHRLGDTLVTLPAVQAVRDHFPKAELDMVVAAGSRDLIAQQPFVDDAHVWPFEEWPIHDLISSYDLALLFRRWELPPHAGGRPLCFSLNTDLLLGPPKLAHLHYLSALKCLGLSPKPRRPHLVLPKSDVASAQRFLREAGLTKAPLKVAVHPGSYYVGKRWFPERYAEVLSWLHLCHDAVFVMIEGRGEEALVEQVTARVPSDRVARVRGRPTGEVAGILAQCSFYLGNDTGILHLADAVDLPSVAVFGPSRPHVWGGASSAAVHVVPDRVWRGCLSCSGRFTKDKPCMRPETRPCLKSITVDEVQGAIEALLGLIGARRKSRALDGIRISDNSFRKRLGRDGLVVANCTGMRPLFALAGASQVEACLEDIREHGSYKQASKVIDARVVDTLLAYRIVLPENDAEPTLARDVLRERRSLLANPVVMEMGRAAQPLDARDRGRRRRSSPKKRRRRGRILLANGIDPLVYGGGERWMLRVGIELSRRGHEVLCWGVAGHQWLTQAEDAGLICLAGTVPETLELEQVRAPTERLRRLGLDAAILGQDREILSLGLPLRLAGVPRVLARKGLPMTDDPPLVRWAHAEVMHGLIVPSQQTGDSILERGWLPPERIHVVPNGVDAKALDRAAPGAELLRDDLGLSERARIVLNIGRLSKHKGTVHLIEAMPRILLEHPDAHLLVVGRGPRWKQLSATVEALGLEKSVHFLGERWDAARLLHLAECFVLPSIYEGMSTALLEAMACRVPVVATAVSGTPEVLEDGVNGLLVPPADAVAIASAVAQILSQPRFARQLAARARDHVQRHHSFHDMVDRVERLLFGGGD